MTRGKLLRWSGLTGVVGGILLLLLDVAFIVAFGDQPERVAAATGTWLILLDLSLLATFLTLLALIGLYARQVEEAGTLGLVAFVIASLGTVMSAGFTWAGGFVIPALTSAAPDFLDQVEASPPGIVAAGFISTFGLFALGWLLFGVASVRAKVVASIPSWLTIAAALLGLMSRFADFGIASVLFGIALAWLGWWLWRERGSQADAV
jgi:hypothetical protein